MRVALASLGVLGLALAGASPALAASGTPTTPTELFTDYKFCATDANAPTYVGGRDGVDIRGIPADTDSVNNHFLTAQYRVWPVSDPTQTTTLTRTTVPTGFEGPVTVPATALTDGQTYAWQAQTVAGSDASDWSNPCYFTVDNTRPSAAPAVTSSNYPQDQWDAGGVPVEFTIDANGADDVAGFEFSWQQDLPVPVTAIGAYGIPQPNDPYDDTRYFVRADRLGGSATLHLVPPSPFGPKTLWVRSLDRAGNVSAMTSYDFLVRSTAPTVTPSDPSPQFGDSASLRLTPNPGAQAASPIVSYTVRTSDDGQAEKTVTVRAAADGTAKAAVVLDGIYGETVKVTSTSANGWVSDDTTWRAGYDTSPTVSSDVYVENGTSGGAGIPGTFSFASNVKDVVSYTYSFDWGATSVTVPAHGDPPVKIHWTPDAGGFYDLNVFATTKDGTQLAPYDYSFSVN
jgi:hypothetical protein